MAWIQVTCDHRKRTARTLTVVVEIGLVLAYQTECLVDAAEYAAVILYQPVLLPWLHRQNVACRHPLGIFINTFACGIPVQAGGRDSPHVTSEQPPRLVAMQADHANPPAASDVAAPSSVSTAPPHARDFFDGSCSSASSTHAAVAMRCQSLSTCGFGARSGCGRI